MVTQAGVYHCIGPAGVLEFQDRPCQHNREKEVFLPYVYRDTQKKLVRLQEKEIQKTMKELKKLERQQKRLNKRQKEEALKEAKRNKRNQERCLKTQEKIRMIEVELRLGCKLKRCQRLKTALSQYESKKRQYCRFER
jgi:Ser-tRNA(Ala) deacylase AlaX